MSEHDVQIATIILQQLGGNRFRAMTGSRDFVAIDRGIQFKVGKNDRAVNLCRVRLNDVNLYDIEYGFLRSGKVTIKATSENVFCGDLQEDFTEHTGMDTHL